MTNSTPPTKASIARMKRSVMREICAPITRTPQAPSGLRWLNDGFMARLHRSVCNQFKAILAVLCLGFFATHAHAQTDPIITLSVEKGMSCRSSYEISYEIAIYEDGTVKYDGYDKVIVKGHREAKIKPKTLRSLIKKFNDSNFMELQSSLSWRAAWMPQYSISMRQGEKVVSVGTQYRFAEYFRHEIIRATGANKWVHEHIDTCYEK